MILDWIVHVVSEGIYVYEDFVPTYSSTFSLYLNTS